MLNDKEKAIKAISLIQNEFYRTINELKRPLFNSRHEAYGVIAEEFEEVKEAIFKDMSNQKLIEELTHLGAMALKALVSCCDLDEDLKICEEDKCKLKT